jgi:hypothetical protein
MENDELNDDVTHNVMMMMMIMVQELWSGDSFPHRN